MPKALSCLWSYEAERRVIKGKGKRPQYHSGKNASPLLRFEGQSTLNVWHLLYPCKSLADVSYLGGSLDEVLAQQTMLIQSKLALFNASVNRLSLPFKPFILKRYTDLLER